MRGERGFTPSPIALAVIVSTGLHLAALNYPGFRQGLDADSKQDQPIEVVLKDMDQTERSDEEETHPGHERLTDQRPAETENAPIPIETDDPRYQSYFLIIKKMISRKWIYPEQSLKKKQQGSVVVEFRLTSDGSLAGIRAADSSGNADLDQAAMNAVRDASPYPRRPDNIKRDPFIISALFVYGQ